MIVGAVDWGKGRKVAGDNDGPCPQGVGIERELRLRELASSSSGSDDSGQLGYLVVDGAPLSHELGDLVHSVDHGRVISPSELTRNGRVAEVGELTEDVHTDLACGNERASSTRSA